MRWNLAAGDDKKEKIAVAEAFALEMDVNADTAKLIILPSPSKLGSETVKESDTGDQESEEHATGDGLYLIASSVPIRSCCMLFAHVVARSYIFFQKNR